MKIDLGGFITKVEFFSPEELETSLKERGITEAGEKGKALLVCDSNTGKLLPDLPGARVVLTPGEEHKTWDSVEKIIAGAVELGLGRDSLFIALGGGVVSDTTAFASSLYMRGAGLILLPTTLLGMTDASLGGKTGIDYRGYKNLIGTFYPASEVLICPEFLNTLPAGEYKNGLAEVIKHALLGEPRLLKTLKEKREAILSREKDTLRELLPAACSVKISYVEEDFKERGRRMHLNFGHTFAHALEKVSNFKIPHGDAVAWGMGKALELGVLLGITPQEYVGDCRKLLMEYGFSLSYPGYNPEALVEAMGRDKKRREGRIKIILQEGFGKTLVLEPPAEKIISVLNL